MNSLKSYNPFAAKKTPKELAKEAKRETKREVRVSQLFSQIFCNNCATQRLYFFLVDFMK
jgi:hypothetical protein